jgi:hypothetical protein
VGFTSVFLAYHSMGRGGNELIFRSIEHLANALLKTLIFIIGADGDSNPFGQPVAAHWPHDNAKLFEVFSHPGSVADLDKDKISGCLQASDSGAIEGVL